MKKLRIFLPWLAFVCLSASPALAHQERSIIVQMTEEGFSPSKVEIERGETVVFSNIGKKEHWPASNIHPTHAIYPEFDPKEPVLPGQSWRLRFERAGIWRYHDHLNPEVVGEIVVEEAEQVFGSRISRDFLSKLVKGLFLEGAAAFRRAYFGLFPEKLGEQLARINIVEIAEDEDELSYWLRVLGTKRFIDAFVSDLDDDTINGCHSKAHLVGKIAYRNFGEGVFSEKAFFCHSGFFHGAIEAFLAEDSTRDIPREAMRICSIKDSINERFSCFHGFGHAIVVFTDYDLPKALQACSRLTSINFRRFCYDGAFMENTLTGLGAGGAQGHETKWISKDLQFPCNAIGKDRDIQEVCFHDQVSRMLWMYGFDFSKTMRECLKQEKEGNRRICFETLGMEAVNETKQNPERIVEICSQEGGYLEYCYTGALRAMLEFWGKDVATQPHELCNLLEGRRFECFQHLGQELYYIFGKDRRGAEEICRLAEDPYRRACQEGVGLVDKQI